MASPLFEIDPGTGTFGAAGVAQNAASGATVILRLADTTGVTSVTWRCIGTHDESTVTAASIDTLIAAGLSGGFPAGNTVTFTLPAGTGRAFGIECTINGGTANGRADASLKTTSAIYVLHGNGERPVFSNETFESGVAGYTDRVNSAIAGAAGSSVSVLNDLTDVDTTGVSASDVLSYDGTGWVPTAPGGGGTLGGLSDVTVSSPATGQGVVYDGSGWVNGQVTDAGIASNAVTTAKILDANVTNAKIAASAGIPVSKLDLSGRTLTAGTGLTGGGDLSADRTFSLSAGLNDLSDVTLTSATTGQPLAHNGSGFVNLTGLYFANGEIRVGTHVTTPTGVGIHLASGEVITYEETSGAQRELIGMDGSHPFIGDDLGTRLFLRTKSSGYFQFEFAGAARYKFDADYLQLTNASVPVPASGAARFYSYLGKPSVAAGGGAVYDLAPLGTDDGVLTQESRELYSGSKQVASGTTYLNTTLAFDIADGEWLEVTVKVRGHDGTAGHYYRRMFTFRAERTGSTVTLGSFDDLHTVENGDGAWDVRWDETTTLGTVTFQIRGDDTNTTEWHFRAEVMRN